ncbi:MAG: tetratricopeptide repeat protein [Roseovarius sp.]
MFRAVLLAALVAPGLAFAKGDDNTKPPSTTKTTTECRNGAVWDSQTGRCVAPKSGALDDDTLYGAVREFAYAGQMKHAQAALAAMSDQSEDRVLTYWGFTTRKLGDMERGMEFYRAALAKNPANIAARSYMGQAFVQLGDTASARAELEAIRANGGEGTWAEISLQRAILTGTTYSY